eukprot:TRINITY_DN10171_c0_g1_i1.p1 TRINITY_DN10171_c0_g1~~TRINITY_DN10171_c0_g1_i1.p1  ORF type:complete len:359 (+),score=110.56 TRINITY_DN10171_c0_g1_i1:40-1116(+)
MRVREFAVLFGNVKAVCLVLLALQNTALTLFVSYSRNIRKEQYILSVDILLSEVLKWLICAAVMFYTGPPDKKAYFNRMMATSLKTMIPALLFFIQNTLLFVALANLDAGIYIVINQLKIFTTAICSVLILQRNVTLTQWRALFVLVLAVVLVQNPKPECVCLQAEEDTATQRKTNIVGIIAAFAMTGTSGFANVFVEKLLKTSDLSLWERNFQLSFYSMIFAALGIAFDWRLVVEKGFFYDFSLSAACIVVIQAVGGILVALVMKFADNIVKGFAISVAIVLTSALSVALFGATVDLPFCVGAGLVIISIFNYNGGGAASQQPRLPLVVRDKDEEAAREAAEAAKPDLAQVNVEKTQ